MKLIDEIIEILSSQDGKLSDALIKTKVLLHQIGHKELVGWVNSELNGYKSGESLPEYRILPAQVLVNATNMAYQISAHPIPLGHLNQEQRESIETAKMDHSLAVLEQFAEKDGGHLQAHIPMETYGLLGQGLEKSYHIQRAWCEVSHISVTQILIQVRSRLLEFVLELQSRVPNTLDEMQQKESLDNVDTKSLFNNAIFGDNATILVGDGNVQKIKNTQIQGDFSALAATLRSNNVSDEDIQALKDAVEEDSQAVNHEDKEYGPAVKRWLQLMLSKAVETSWNIELGVASSLLATALNNFYGWF